MIDDATQRSPDEARIEVDEARLVRRLFWFCVACELLLVLADVVINYGKLTEIGPIRRYFNITREDGIASWFAVTQTWMIGLTALLIWSIVRAQSAPRWRRLGWLLIGVFFLYMAIDDGSELHERVGSAVKEWIGEPSGEEGVEETAPSTGGLGFFPSYPWQLIFVPGFVAAGLGAFAFFRREFSRRGLLVRVGLAFGLLGVAVACDFAEGMQLEHRWNPYGHLMRALELKPYDIRHFSKAFEEFLEMLAMTLIWTVLLQHLARLAPKLTVHFRDRE